MNRRHPLEQEYSIRNVVVDANDLETILQVFKLRGLKVTLYAQKEKSRSISEIVHRHGSHVNELEIHCYDEKFGSISILFRNGHVRIRSSGSFVTRALRHELVDLLVSRRNIKKQIFSWGGWRSVAFAAFTAEFILLFMSPILEEIPFMTHVCLWIAAILWPLFHLFSISLPAIRLIPHTKRKQCSIENPIQS